MCHMFLSRSVYMQSLIEKSCQNRVNNLSEKSWQKIHSIIKI
jgi:hypothetical protein